MTRWNKRRCNEGRDFNRLKLLLTILKSRYHDIVDEMGRQQLSDEISKQAISPQQLSPCSVLPARTRTLRSVGSPAVQRQFQGFALYRQSSTPNDADDEQQLP